MYPEMLFFLCMLLCSGAELCSGCVEGDVICETREWSVADVNAKALEMARAGRPGESIGYFKAGRMKLSDQPVGWCNLGLALAQDAREKLNADGNPSKRRRQMVFYQMKESLASFDIGRLIAPSEPSCIENERLVESWFKQIFPSKCSPSQSRCPRSFNSAKYSDMEKSIGHFLEHETSLAVKTLCRSKTQISVKLTADKSLKQFHSDPNDPLTRLSTFSMRNAVAVYFICGVVVFEKALPSNVIDKVNVAVQPMALEFMEKVKVNSSHTNTTTSSERSPYRYELFMPLEDPFTDPHLVANNFIMQVTRTLISSRVEIDTFSYVVSAPGAPDQHWHKDCPDLFQSSEGSTVHYPSHGFVMLIPTAELSKLKGPTEVVLGTHLVEESHSRNVLLDGNVGDCILMDLRVMHRGTANRSDGNRALLYISYVRDWWMDRINFRDLQTKWFDQLGTRTERKLFSRLDSRRYAMKLEEMVVQLGGDLESVKSSDYLDGNDLRYEDI